MSDSSSSVSEGDVSRGEQTADVLRVTGLKKYFPVRSGLLRGRVGDIRAVDGVDFAISAGETLGLVGESGCGKTTLARTVARLLRPTSGEILLEGRDITGLSPRAMRPLRRHLQVVFQDPYTSLNPGMTVYTTLSEPLKLHGQPAGREIVGELLMAVGLAPEHLNRYPHEFSGGQRQRIGIARALALNPRLLVLDEPVSALDVSIQAQIINLLRTLQIERQLTYLLIAHDLAVVHHVATRVAVMYLGKIVETGDRDDIYRTAMHPYTQALLSAIPPESPAERHDRTRIVLQGDPPSPANPPSGCRFRTRCWKAEAICAAEEPKLLDHRRGHAAACHFAEPLDVSRARRGDAQGGQVSMSP